MPALKAKVPLAVHRQDNTINQSNRKYKAECMDSHRVVFVLIDFFSHGIIVITPKSML